MENETNYTVTPETAAFIKALDALENAKAEFYTALQIYYGDAAAENIFTETAPSWNAAGEVVSKYLMGSIRDNLAPVHTSGDCIRI